MENQTSRTIESQPSVVPTATFAEVFGGATTTQTQPETQPNVQTQDVINPPAQEETKPAAQTEPAKTTDQPAGETKADTAKTDETTPADEIAPILELKVDDIKDVPQTYKEGTWQHFSSKIGLELPTESAEEFEKLFAEKFVPKEEAQKQADISKEKFFATLDPKTATMLNLIELGVPEQYVANPTAPHDELLSLDDAQLVRWKLERIPGFEAQDVEFEMEELSKDPAKMQHYAKKERIEIATARQNILNEQAQLVQKYTEAKSQATLQQKTEQTKAFNEALSKETTFMGLTLSKEVKDAIQAKKDKGAYDSLLSDSQAMVRAILQLEYGEKFSSVLQSKAKEEGKAEIVRKLSNVPEKKPLGVQTKLAPNDSSASSKSPYEGFTPRLA